MLYAKVGNPPRPYDLLWPVGRRREAGVRGMEAVVEEETEGVPRLSSRAFSIQNFFFFSTVIPYWQFFLRMGCGLRGIVSSRFGSMRGLCSALHRKMGMGRMRPSVEVAVGGW